MSEEHEPSGWRVVVEESWAAYVAGYYPVGAAVVDAGGVVLSRGRNRVGPGDEVEPLRHAELEALQTLELPLTERAPCTLLAGLEPCPLCFGALYMSNVRGLEWAVGDPWAGSVDLLGKTPYMRRKEIRLSRCPDAAVTRLLRTLVAVHELQLAALRENPVMEARARDGGSVPDGVVAEGLSTLRELGERDAPVDRVVEWVESMWAQHA